MPKTANPPASLRDEQSSATRKRIVDAVVFVAANEHPASFSVPAVAKQAGVSLRTVYRYFPTKEDLLDAIAQQGDTALRLRDVEKVRLDGYLELMPQLYRDLYDTRVALRQQLTNPVLREARERRIQRRRTTIRKDVAERVPSTVSDAQLDAASALLCTVSSSLTMLDLTEVFGLDAEDAGRMVAWAMRALIDVLHDRPDQFPEVGHAPHQA